MAGIDPVKAANYAAMVEAALALPEGAGPDGGPVVITLDAEARALKDAAVHERLAALYAAGGDGGTRDEVVAIGTWSDRLLETALILHMMRCMDPDDPTCYPTHADGSHLRNPVLAHLTGKDPTMRRIDGLTMRGAIALVDHGEILESRRA